MPDSHRRAALALLFASVLFSTGGAAIKAVRFQRVADRQPAVGNRRADAAAAGPGGPARLGLAAPAWSGRPTRRPAICFVLANRLTTSARRDLHSVGQSALRAACWPAAAQGAGRPARHRCSCCRSALGLALFLLGNERPVATAPGSRWPATASRRSRRSLSPSRSSGCAGWAGRWSRGARRSPRRRWAT